MQIYITLYKIQLYELFVVLDNRYYLRVGFVSTVRYIRTVGFVSTVLT